MTQHSNSLLDERLSALEDPRDDSSWEDVLRRTLEQPLENGRRFRGRRTLLIAAVIAALVLALGVALAATLGGFSDWLSGKPGSPASQTEQSAFRQANARSWAAFPSGTKLRRLIVTRSEGSTYRLFGFRSGDEICLRLTVDGADRGALMSCFPRLQLVNTKAPAIAGLIDAPAGKLRVIPEWRKSGHSKKRLSIHSGLVSFGLSADGTSIVELRYGHESGRARVASDAFLFVRANHPYSTIKVTRLLVGDSSNNLVGVPLSASHWSRSRNTPPPKSDVPFGPSRVEFHPVKRGVKWVSRREPRGLSLQQARVPSAALWGHYYGIHFARVIQPDPNSHMRVAVAVIGRHDAIFLTPLDSVSFSARRSGGRGPADFRYHQTLSVWEEIGIEEQMASISGLGIDAVDRIDLYLSDGERWQVPYHDNIFSIEIPRTLLPGKLVAYDRQDRVIGINIVTDVT